MLLYPLYDFQQACLLPWHMAAQMFGASACFPALPWASPDMGRMVATSMAAWERATRPASLKPAFEFEDITFRGVPLTIREEIVARHPFCNLLHFARSTPDVSVGSRMSTDPRVLLIAPLAGYFATLLRDTVEALLPEHDVYITDWIDAKNVPLSQGNFDLEDCIGLLMDQMRQLGAGTHVIAVAEASPAAFCATALLSERRDPAIPCSLTLLGGPIDAQAGQASLTQQAASQPLQWIHDNMIQAVPFYYPGANRLVFPGFVQRGAFLLWGPDKLAEDPLTVFTNLIRGNDAGSAENDRFYDEFLAVMDLPASLYLQTIERIYQNFDLPRGTFRWKDKLVKPAAIQKTALLTVEGEMDDVMPPGQTRAAHALCTELPSDMKAEHLEIGVGHFGVFQGRKWHNNIMPVVRSFIRSHQLRRSA